MPLKKLLKALIKIAEVTYCRIIRIALYWLENRLAFKLN